MSEEAGSDAQHLAIHEAGHAVIGRVLRHVCGHVTIIADEDSAGHSITADPWLTIHEWEAREIYRSYESAIRSRIIVIQAGVVAEEVLLGSCEGGDGEDRRQAFMMAESLSAPDPDELLARLRRSCRYLVERKRGAIILIADRLKLAGTISAAEADSLVSGALHRLPVSNPLVMG